MNRQVIFYLLIALVIGFILRYPQLDVRPMHNDEAVNTIKLRTLWETGIYKYDPLEYHGPTLPYTTFAWMKLFGPKHFEDFTESQIRSITVAFGLGLILLLPLMANDLGAKATICAAFLTAVSSAMVFYSRYYIHEMLLVFLTSLALAAGWRFSRSGKLSWALITGAAIGLMQATKETFVLTLAAAGIALVLEIIWTKWFDEKRTPKITLNYKFLIGALGIWIVIAATLFSSFFTNMQGLVDAFRTYLPWIHRAAGASPHIHPWYYYLERLAYFHPSRKLIWSEGLILILAVVGMSAVFLRKTLSEGSAEFIRFVAFYTIILTAIYCAIGYKTPWCLLSFWQGMILMAGVGTVFLIRQMQTKPLKLAVSILLAAFAFQLGLQARRASIDYASETKNPYTYSQTSEDILNLVERVNALTNVSPETNQTLVKVMAPESDFWPLPWYFRRLKQVGWYSEIPFASNAPVVIVSTKLHSAFETNNGYIMAGIFALRPQTFFELYVETNLWRANLERNGRDRIDKIIQN